MIREADALDEDVVPDREVVVHRREEIDTLIDILQPIEGGSVSGFDYLIGPPGTGKTITARLAVGALKEYSFEYSTSHIHCWKTNTQHDILVRLVRDLLDVPIQQNRSDADLLERLRADVDEHRYVILDEVDQLPNDAIYHYLYRIPNLKTILIANDEADILSKAQDSTRSRIAVGRRITFDPYSTDELANILEKRAEYGLRDGAVTRKQLEHIGRLAEGDARLAIRILWEAAQDADERTIDDENIESGSEQARRMLRRKNIDRLSENHVTLLEIVQDLGPVAPSNLYKAYADRVDDPRSERTVRKYLRKMERYNLIESEGQRANKKYRAPHKLSL